MNATLLDLPSRPRPAPASSTQPGGRRVTLEERLQSACRGLHAQGVAECPVCGGRMTVGAGGGECGGCGARLS
jgi:hypothetical protein